MSLNPHIEQVCPVIDLENYRTATLRSILQAAGNRITAVARTAILRVLICDNSGADDTISLWHKASSGAVYTKLLVQALAANGSYMLEFSSDNPLVLAAGDSLRMSTTTGVRLDMTASYYSEQDVTITAT